MKRTAQQIEKAFDDWTRKNGVYAEGTHGEDCERAWRSGYKLGQDDLREELMKLAERYQKADGTPGDLSANCWGWRDIATALKSAATSA